MLIVRSEPAAEDSLADILARIRFGIAMAAMIRMIATTISNSMSEKPFPLLLFGFDLVSSPQSFNSSFLATQPGVFCFNLCLVLALSTTVDLLISTAIVTPLPGGHGTATAQKKRAGHFIPPYFVKHRV